MREQEELFYKWMNLKEEIQNIAAIIQNPLGLNDITSTNLSEWKTQCIHFEETYARIKQSTEKFITTHLIQPPPLTQYDMEIN